MHLALKLNDGTRQDTKCTYNSIEGIDQLPEFTLGSNPSYTKSVINAYGGSCLTAGKTLEEWKKEIEPNRLRKLDEDECHNFLSIEFIEENPDIEIWVDEDHSTEFYFFGFFHQGVCFHSASYALAPSYHTRLEFIRYILGSHTLGSWNAMSLTDKYYVFRIAESKNRKFTAITARDSYLLQNSIGTHIFCENELLFDSDRIIPEHSRFRDGMMPYRRFLSFSENCDEGFARYIKRRNDDSQFVANQGKTKEIEELIHDSLSSVRKEYKDDIQKSIYITLGIVAAVALMIHLS
jgi:hypothetical protein